MLRALILGLSHLACFGVGVVATCFVIAAAGRPTPEDSKARLAQSPYFKDLRITNDDIRAELGLPPEQRRANDN